MIDPRTLTWQQWANAVLMSISDSWALGTPPDETNWRDFAVGFVRAPSFAQRLLPDPYQFSDWRDWATRAYPMLEGLG
jgi:hypothetical protein